jgi:hypothetical protein
MVHTSQLQAAGQVQVPYWQGMGSDPGQSRSGRFRAGWSQLLVSSMGCKAHHRETHRPLLFGYVGVDSTGCISCIGLLRYSTDCVGLWDRCQLAMHGTVLKCPASLVPDLPPAQQPPDIQLPIPSNPLSLRPHACLPSPCNRAAWRRWASWCSAPSWALREPRSSWRCAGRCLGATHPQVLPPHQSLVCCLVFQRPAQLCSKCSHLTKV